MDSNHEKAALLGLMKEWGIRVPGDLAARLALYADLLLEWNARTNLTAIVSPAEIWAKHFADSLSCLRVLTEPNISLIDVGSGAGFPGMVLAMARPDWAVSLMDAARKRTEFLSFISRELNIANVRVTQARAEDGGRDSLLRETFDVAVARGVAALRILAEYCLPLVRPGGRFIAMKGPGAADELHDSSPAISALGGCWTRTDMFELPQVGTRALVVIRKELPTPSAFPRRAGMPEKKPL